ncbi:MAG TPA: hypothetical protein DDW81_02160 [Cryomorphaceae bacterium]|nr:hypothetical protein [Owenweeksia sp.]HBF18868.1 hypothetical protein [Cryomorphaceae bacterium]|tara:strand:+ start:107 stop:829 length:723 start_codon:yes stop_codon:yes gene_type:complete
MKNILAGALILASTLLTAQTYKLKSDEMKGQIVTLKGEVLNGYIKLKGDTRSPWNNQESVEFFTEDAMADGKVKGKEREKYRPDDIKAYIAGDRYFEAQKFSLMKMTMGMGIAKWYFIERMVDGDISLYRFYDTPDAVTVTTTEAERVAYEEELESMRTNPNLLLKKDDEMTTLQKVDFAAYISKCPEVQEKYKTGGYGIEPFHQDAETKLGKFIAKQVNSQQVMVVLPQILEDYNACVE